MGIRSFFLASLVIISALIGTACQLNGGGTAECTVRETTTDGLWIVQGNCDQECTFDGEDSLVCVPYEGPSSASPEADCAGYNSGGQTVHIIGRGCTCNVQQNDDGGAVVNCS